MLYFYTINSLWFYCYVFLDAAHLIGFLCAWSHRSWQISTSLILSSPFFSTASWKRQFWKVACSLQLVVLTIQTSTVSVERSCIYKNYCFLIALKSPEILLWPYFPTSLIFFSKMGLATLIFTILITCLQCINTLKKF